MFLIQEGFYKRLIQIFKSLKEKSLTKKKLKIIQQILLASIYSTEFQMWATRTSQNKEVLIAKYRQELKLKV